MTMDSVARTLGISKRTLYELFESKESMVRAVFSHFHENHARLVKAEVSQTSNSIEALTKALNSHLSMMKDINVGLVHDLDSYYSNLRPEFEQYHKRMCMILLETLNRGVEEGVFCDDIDYRITMRLFMLQMESLKRMEEYFPADVTLPEAYRHIVLSLLRSVATQKGREILEHINDKNNDNKEKIPQYENK